MKMIKRTSFMTVLLISTILFFGCSPKQPANPTPPVIEDPDGDNPEPEPGPDGIEATVAVSTSSTLSVRKSPGSKDKPDGDVIIRLASGNTVFVTNKHDNNIVRDGYIWWEIYFPDTGERGWAAAEFIRIEGEDPVVVPIQKITIKAKDYFPVQYEMQWRYVEPGSDHMWECSILNEPVFYLNTEAHTINIEYFIIEANNEKSPFNEGSKTYIFKTLGLYEVYGGSGIEGVHTYDNPKLIIKNASPGDVWEYTVGDGHYRHTFKGFKTVQTQAGKFSDCIEIEEVITAGNQTYRATRYYAKSIGLVKTTSGGQTIEELQWYLY
jgi:hypothetical protein